MLYNTLLINKKKKKKKISINSVIKVKGISEDTTRKAWVVKKTGLKRKRFSYRKCTKEEAYEMAKLYILGFTKSC